jgi:aryl-phospho-beta-D-glucosidase BglC (GH1 family)/ribosomal protein L35AE/L33A
MSPRYSRSKKDFWGRTVRTSHRLSIRSPFSIEPLEDRRVMAVTYSTVNEWGSGLQGQVAISNDQSSTISNWRLEFDYSRAISDIWNAQIVSHTGTHYVIEGVSWNSTIAVGQTASFGFTAGSGSGAPSNFSLNGGGVAPETPPGITIGDVTLTEGNPSTASVSGYFHTSGNQILDANNNVVKIAGVNWFGLETTNYAPHGLWTRNYKSMMDQMKELGFNTIRLPYSDQLFESGSTPNGIDFFKNPDLQGLTGLQIMDKIVDYAGQIGMRIMLDHHRSNAGNSANESGLWYSSAFPESKWISNWTMLAARYANNATVIGADLHNEPHGPATWGDGSANDWRLAAERAGNAILAVNSNWLIIVEGVEAASSGNYWWGGNLSNAGASPVRLNQPGRLVYSAHDYPASVYQQSWFSDPNYPNNLTQVWDRNWGYLFRQGTAPVILGEFGSNLATASDRLWFDKMIAYLGGDLDGNGTNDLSAGQQGISWTYWAWNPNSGDTGGILASDWNTVNQDKVSKLTPIEFSFGSGNATTTAVFTVTLSKASSQTVTVQYATANGTATAGSDYTAASGAITFAPGETSRTVAVPITRDTLAEATETFTLLLSNATGATITRSTATGTIQDDDITSTLASVSVGNVSLNEGNSGSSNARFTVTLNQAASAPVTVVYATANGTATAGSDYTAKSGTLTFAAGELSKTVDVAVAGDTQVESDETFLLRLTSATGATIATPQATGTILNDDLAPPVINVSVGNVAKNEGNSGTAALRFSVTLNQAAGAPVTVVYATANGTATSGSDYTAKTGTLTFAAGEISKAVDVLVVGDTLIEADETFLLRLTSASGATIATSQATGTIQNDDQAPSTPSISIGNATLTEGNSGTANMVFTVTLSQASTSAVTVRYATANGTAIAGSDYNAASGTLTFAAGQTSKLVTVAVRGDTLAEAAETFKVQLSSAGGATIASGIGTGTITDNDQPPTASAVTFTTRSDWGAGYTSDVKIKNTGTTPINGWTIEFDLDADITNLWSGVIVSRVGNHYVVKMESWNGTIAPGGEVTFGFQATGTGRVPTNVKLNGVAV